MKLGESISRDQSFAVLGLNRPSLLTIAAGSIVGDQMLGLVPSAVLLLALAAILVISASKVWRYA